MIQAEGISLSYHGEPVLSDVGFTMQKGERCALLGRNGAGKSTLFRLITGREQPDQGRIILPKHYRLGTLDQHIRFTKENVLEETAQGLAEEEQYKAEALLSGLGFDEEQLELPPERLSGGFQLRVQLAKVLLSEPDCLLLDEPTNYLDILSIRFLIRFLQRWRGEMIVISHDREFLDQIVTHTMGIHRHKVVKVCGKTADYYTHIVQQEELHERSREKIDKKRAHLESYIERFGAKASKAAQAQSRQKMLGRLPQLEELKSLAHLDFSFHEAPFPGKKMLEANDLSFSYNAPLIHDLSLTVEKGERIAIIGKNGCGKSTVLRLIAGDLSPQNGSIQVRDGVFMGYFGQTNINRLDPKMTIEEEIGSANVKLNLTQVRGICGLMMFGSDLAQKKISNLSGGEKSRVLLGKILAHPCNLLLLDEPTHHLDVESVEALIDAIEEFSGSCILVTHSELILNRLHFDKLVICHSGGRQQVFLGTYAEFLAKVGWEEERQPQSKAPQPNARRTRAELVADRAKALKPILNRIQTCEEKISVVEIELEDQQQALISHPQSKDMQERLRGLAKKREQSEALYAELEKLLQEKEKIEKEFQ